MAGGGDEVAVTGVKIEISEAGEGRKWIWHCAAHVDLRFGKQIAEQRKASLAFETLEEGGEEDLGIVAFSKILEKITATLE